MEALKTTGKSKNGLLTVQIPETFDGQELEVIILSLKDDTNIEKNVQEDKTQRLLRVIGSVPDKHKNFDKHDVYDQ